jgi:hypothetical protein
MRKTMMSDQDISADAQTQPQDPAPEPQQSVPRDELRRVIGQRQALKGQLQQAEGRIAEYEAAAKEAAEMKLREQQQNEQIITERDGQIDALQKEIARMQRAQRFGSTVTAVTAKTGLDRAIVEGLLLREEVGGVDVSPESLSDEHVSELAERIRKSAPSLFQSVPTGGSPGDSGTKNKSKAYSLAQSMSQHNRR